MNLDLISNAPRSSTTLKLMLGCVIIASAAFAAESSDTARIIEAAKARADLAATISTGKMSPADAMNALRQSAAPLGLKFEAKEEYSMAVVDIGQRLVAKGKGTEAETFFREAEAAIAEILDQSAKQSPGERARLLSQLAFIRVAYLNEADKAKADFDEAIKLEPLDQSLRQLRDHLGSANGMIFGAKGAAKPDEAPKAEEGKN
ncbi:MAG: hypothetical protein ABIZ04_01600 [Opitutus sp.]